VRGMQAREDLTAREFGRINGTDVQEHGRCAGAAILGEILGTHLRGHLADAVGTEIATEYFRYVSSQRRIVVHRIRTADDLD
jgi:hypothetical protein